MATIQQNISKKTGKVINWKWTALLGREGGKQIRVTKRVPPYSELTPAKERKQMQRDADDWEQAEREAYKKLKGETAEEKTKIRREKDRITLVDFIDNVWMEKRVKHGAKEHTPDTIAFYTNMGNDIKAYFNGHFPGLKLCEVDLTHVRDYLIWMQRDAKTRRGTPYGATTRQHHYSTLRNVFEFAVYMKYVKSNPCKEIMEDERPQRANKGIVFLDEDEAITFLDRLSSDAEAAYWKTRGLPKKEIEQGKINQFWYADYLYWKCVVNIFITTGLRRGELVGLQWGDIDRDNLLFKVQRNVTIDTSNKEDNDPHKKIHVGKLKCKDDEEFREVPFLWYIMPMLDELKAEQEKRYEAALMPSAYIFCRETDPYLPLYPTEPTRMMAKFIKRHDLPNVSPHDLRHTAGYLAKVGGADVKDIQAMYGHNDPKTSLKLYIGYSRKTQRRTADSIGKVLHIEQTQEKATAEN